jgi:DNA (cytosine-5)-methyltransferase 1
MVFEQVCTDLENKGYEVQPFIIPASSVNAPHQRYRVWIVAHSESIRSREVRHSDQEKGVEISSSTQFNSICGDVADSEHARLQRLGQEHGLSKTRSKIKISWESWWDTESTVGRVADGLPRRVDRLKGLGNAIVPAIAYQLGLAILEAENYEK